MKATLIKTVNVLILLMLVILERPAASVMGQPARRKSDLQLYTVSLPIGYGALSAYNALPKPLAHAPYALRGLNNYTSTKIGSVRKLEFGDINRKNYGLDWNTFVKLFGHEFEDYNANKDLLKL